MEIIDGGMIMGEKINLSACKPKLAAIDRKPSRIAESKIANDKFEDSDPVSSSISSESDSDVSNAGPAVPRPEQVAVKNTIPALLSRKDSGLPSSRSSLSSIASLQQESKDENQSDNNTGIVQAFNNNNNNNAINSQNNVNANTPQLLNQLSVPRISKNTEQIEALLRRINEENQKTKEVLESIQRNELRKELKSIQKLSNSPTRPIPASENSLKSDPTTNDAASNIKNFNNSSMDKNGNSKLSPKPSKTAANPDDPPLVTWETSGEGKKIPVVMFNCQALSRPQPLSVGQKYHLTFKTINADAKLVSQICHAHGFHEVHSSNCDYNLVWTGAHPKPHAFKSMLPHQRVNHFPRSYELTRKDRLYQNIERLQHSKGTKHFNFVPKTFMIPTEYSEFAATHHRMRGAWIVKPVASSRGRGIFIVSHPNQVPLDEPMVVAKYIDNPLLVNGHKWDLRLYVAVTSYDPLCIYLYEEGLVRFATVRYDSTGKNLWNPCMHLCNYSINKYHSDYIKSDDPNMEDLGHKWTLSALLRHLKANNIDTIGLMQNIEDVIIKSIISVEFPVNSACKMFVPHRRNCFELYGFDILIDSDLKPWLLEVNLSPSLNCDTPIDMKIKSALICDLLNLIGLPAVDPVLKRAQFNQKIVNMTQQQEDNSRAKLGIKRQVSAETRRFAAIRLAANSSSLSQELSRMVKNAREENSRRGGWVRIFPTADTWSAYGSMLEYSSTNNQILHEHLFPDAARKQRASRKRQISHPPTKTLFDRKRSQSAGPSKQDRDLIICVRKKVDPEEEDKVPSRANSRASNASESEIARPTASELRVAQYEKSLTKGHCPSRTRSEVERKDPEKIAKTRLERRERSNVLKEKVIKLIEGGLQLSEYQARKAFSVYLNCILQRLSDFDDTCGDVGQIELVLKFLQKAALSLREPYYLKAPSIKLSGKDRAAIVAKELNEFLGHYRRETEFFTVFREEAGMVPRHTFEEFVAFANDSDLEEVLTIQTKLYRCAHIFLGKCLPPVNGKRHSLLRTAYGISPDRNIRDKQCNMRVNARANPPTAPQYSLPSQPPNKCLDIPAVSLFAATPSTSSTKTFPDPHPDFKRKLVCDDKKFSLAMGSDSQTSETLLCIEEIDNIGKGSSSNGSASRPAVRVSSAPHL